MGDFTLILSILNILTLLFLVLTERKFLAYSHRRLGPVLFGRNGLFQILFDLLKLMGKQIFLIPRPTTFITPIFLVFLFSLQIFFSQTFIFGPLLFNLLLLESQLLYHLFLIIISNVFFSLIGLFSLSRYAIIGTIRGLVHIISLDIFITLIYSLLVFISQSTNFNNFIESQNIYMYLIIYLQISFSFILILLLESKRTPFDHAETESEVVSGYSTEYSASMLMIFYLSEYAHLIISTIAFIIFFLGGWNSIYFFFFIPSIFIFPNSSILIVTYLL